LALNAFDRGQIGNYITINGKLRVEKCGEIIAGSISVLQPSANYGSGAYIHPSVVVKSYGELHLINNVAGSWRTYSSSGYGAGDPGDFSYYAKIVEQGSQVYTLLTSNNHHTVIDRIESNTGILRLRHDLTINGGFVRQMVSYIENFGQGDRTIELSNLTINVPCDLRLYAHATFNNCTYRAVKYTDRNVCVIPPSKTCIVNGGEMITSSGVGDFAGPGQNPQGDQGSS